MSRWSPLFNASVAIEIDKNGLEARKLPPLKIGGHFERKFLIKHLIAYFETCPKKSLNIILNITQFEQKMRKLCTK
jgi:hypothetical protein